MRKRETYLSAPTTCDLPTKTNNDATAVHAGMDAI